MEGCICAGKSLHTPFRKLCTNMPTRDLLEWFLLNAYTILPPTRVAWTKPPRQARHGFHPNTKRTQSPSKNPVATVFSSQWLESRSCASCESQGSDRFRRKRSAALSSIQPLLRAQSRLSREVLPSRSRNLARGQGENQIGFFRTSLCSTLHEPGAGCVYTSQHCQHRRHVLNTKPATTCDDASNTSPKARLAHTYGDLILLGAFRFPFPGPIRTSTNEATPRNSALFCK